MATYAVGDLQGCLQPLKKLLRDCNFNPDRDQLWLVGDLVNRGPESLAALRFVYQRRDHLVTVLGNHDLHLLAAAEGQRELSRSDTLDEILAAPDRDQLLDWLRRQPLLHRDRQLGFTLVHAGIPPCWNLDEAEARAREVEAVLRSDRYRDYFANMYGNQPNRWRDDLQGPERWRLITNYFTRMRFCATDSTLELSAKGGLDSGLPGFAPWFAHPKRKTAGEHILFGHWAGLEGRAPADDVYALDTGCVWGGCMSMLRLEDRAWFRCDC